jgi:hypothetical protein
MATFNWSIANTERYLDTGGVFIAHWRCNASETVGEDVYSATSYGTCGFSPDPSSPDWVAYDDLTEAQCLQWCWDNGVDKDATEASLASNIEAQKHPVSESGVPWAA